MAAAISRRPTLPPGMTRPAAAAWIGEDPQAAGKVFRDLMSASTGTRRAVQNGMFTVACPFPGRLVPCRAGLYPGRRLLADPLPGAGHRHRGRAGLHRAGQDPVRRSPAPGHSGCSPPRKAPGTTARRARRCCPPSAPSTGSRKPQPRTRPQHRISRQGRQPPPRPPAGTSRGNDPRQPAHADVRAQMSPKAPHQLTVLAAIAVIPCGHSRLRTCAGPCTR